MPITPQNEQLNIADDDQKTILSVDQENSLVRKIRQKNNFKQLLSLLNDFHKNIKDKNLKIFLKDNKQINVWQAKLQSSKNNNDINKVLNEAFSDPQLVLSFCESIKNSISKIKEEMPELNNTNSDLVCRILAS